MTLNITDAELHEWAKMRADDAGRLARELVACRRQSQATVAAAYEAAAQVAIDRKGFGSDAALVHPYDKGYVAACDAIATAIRALATPDQIAALAAERAATVTVNPLVWVQSHLTSWNDDWHTIPTAYTIRCCDENGWKWQGNGGHGYESSAKHAMTAVQGIHEAAIRSAITLTSGASPDTIPLPRAEVEDVADTLNLVADWMEKAVKDRRIIGPEFHVPTLRKALATLQERMK